MAPKIAAKVKEHLQSHGCFGHLQCEALPDPQFFADLKGTTTPTRLLELGTSFTFYSGSSSIPCIPAITTPAKPPENPSMIPLPESSKCASRDFSTSLPSFLESSAALPSVGLSRLSGLAPSISLDTPTHSFASFSVSQQAFIQDYIAHHPSLTSAILSLDPQLSGLSMARASYPSSSKMIPLWSQPIPISIAMPDPPMPSSSSPEPQPRSKRPR
ncbi:hypothetical protein NE237_016434 [Protea cynaroides]|uniref:Uncharacterized protein n=1 Tax=Protea cynaroides TaxID=273540 RepID=A0A9Q0HH31_9MAGN|nr:hypothetical protein NE237_016434 [Protea cynaroides]